MIGKKGATYWAPAGIKAGDPLQASFLSPATPPLPLPPASRQSPTNLPPVSYLTSQTNPFELRAELVSSTLLAWLVTYIGLLPFMPRPHTEVPYLHLVYGLMAGGFVVKCVATRACITVYSHDPSALRAMHVYMTLMCTWRCDATTP